MPNLDSTEQELRLQDCAALLHYVLTMQGREVTDTLRKAMQDVYCRETWTLQRLRDIFSGMNEAEQTELLYPSCATMEAKEKVSNWVRSWAQEVHEQAVS